MGAHLTGSVTRPGDPLPAVTAAMLKAYAADKRYRVETGGVVDKTFGAIATDRDTQGAIDRTLSALDKGIATAPVDFKSVTGWYSVDQPTLLAIAKIVAQHVQSAFSKEKEAGAAIDDGTITTFAQIDARWPG